MIETKLLAAGWRKGEPERNIRSAWVCAGGAWQAVIAISDGDAIVERFDAVRGHRAILWSRPVHGISWDYAPEGWGIEPARGDDPVGFQNAPMRYTAKGRETIDRIRDELGEVGFVAFCIGNAMKYEDRAGLKGDAESDLLKARWYRAMALHVTTGSADPRSGRPGFEGYRRPETEGER